MRTLLFLLLVLISVGCQKNPLPKTPRSILHLNMSEDPASLDPRQVRRLKDLTLVKQLYEGLFRLDQEGIPSLALAESFSISEDQLTYQFTLREAYWSNGECVTAEDFIKAWQEALTPSFASDYSHILYPIKNAQPIREGKSAPATLGVSAPDEKTLVVKLESPTPYFLELLAFPTYSPLHAAKIGLYNGPFLVESWKVQEELRLKRNPLYWDAEQVHLDGISITMIADEGTETYLFDRGELDWIGQPLSNPMTAEYRECLYSEKKLCSYPICGTFWFRFNTLKPPFDQVKIRKAFSYAIQRQEIITHILQGEQMSATTLLPPTTGLQAEPYFKDGEQEHAKKLFEEALQECGWTLKTFPKVTLKYLSAERNTKIAEQVQQQWQETFGVPISLERVEMQVYQSAIRQGLYQVGTGDWIGDFNDPIAFLELFAKGNEMQGTGWMHPEYTALVEASFRENHPDQRKALLFQAEKILSDEMPIAPVYHYLFEYAKKEYVTDVVLSRQGIADFKKTEIR